MKRVCMLRSAFDQRLGLNKQCGWDVVRFTDEEVVQDVEAVARAIAKHLGLNFEFCKRNASGSGMENIHAPNKRKA
jgi:hypothetical protein